MEKYISLQRQVLLFILHFFTQTFGPMGVSFLLPVCVEEFIFLWLSQIASSVRPTITSLCLIWNTAKQYWFITELQSFNCSPISSSSYQTSVMYCVENWCQMLGNVLHCRITRHCLYPCRTFLFDCSLICA